MGKFRARLSEKPPSDPQLERGLHKEAVDFHAAAIPLDMASEGVQAFATIIAQIIAGDPKIIVVDEPEAFLHPALAMKLGNELAISASKSNKQVFVSTHSANFVMGCIQSGAHVTIVRLTYLRGVATARSLPNDRILTLMRNPLLRSAGVINGVFYQAVVVTESDTDRAFYQEINERLLRYDSSRGIPHCLFLNAQNKQTVHIICEPLRRLGIPTVCIVDIDILKEGGSVWASFLSGGCLPLSAQQGLGDMRAKIKLKCVNSGQDMKKGGTAILDQEGRETADFLFDSLASYGLFVVRSGEIESWLTHLQSSGHGSGWLIKIFERMGENQDDNTYIKPTKGDVWDFMASVGSWLRNPNRKGIPLD